MTARFFERYPFPTPARRPGFPPFFTQGIDDRNCCMATSGAYESPRAFSRDMDRTNTSKPTAAATRVACLWQRHGAFAVMDGSVSGRTIG